MPKVLMPSFLASARARCSWWISTMNTADGSRLRLAIPPKCFSILACSRLRVRRSFLVMVVSVVVGEHPLDVLHLLDRLADGLEVGHHATQPALGHEGHADAFGGFLYDIAGLFFGGDEHDLLAAFGHGFHGEGGALHAFGRAVEVDDVDPLMLHEDVRRHLRVPFFAQVTEVATGIEQFFISGLLHCSKADLRCMRYEL